jgi:hypothetical protein
MSRANTRRCFGWSRFEGFEGFEGFEWFEWFEEFELFEWFEEFEEFEWGCSSDDEFVVGRVLPSSFLCYSHSPDDRFVGR